MQAAKLLPAKVALDLKSSISISPLTRDFTGTTFIPTICADAGFVPCADIGIKQIFRFSWLFSL